MAISDRSQILPWVLLLGSLAGTSNADGGSDFSNNLFSDLAPVLALFGEKFTLQFLSEAYSWLDCVIFSFAPLGIITAIVGAIRVAGYPWMRSVIGRARENRAATEIEFLSSTSHEVCELWNGNSIVRTMGRPLVAQIVVVEKEMGNADTLGLYTLDNVGAIMEATDYKMSWKGRSKNVDIALSKAAAIYSYIRRIMKRLGRPQRDLETRSVDLENMGSQDDGQTESTSETSSDPSTATHSLADKQESEKTYTTEAPNILLNLHGGTSLTILIPAAMVGILLQIGVLTFAGLASKWPQFALEIPSSESATDYGFPLLLLGTVFLTAGLFIVTLVIEQSTEEMKWVVKDDGTNASSNVRVLWLQREHVVGDQAFDSYLLMQNNKCAEVLTSRRAKMSVPTGKQDIGGLSRSFFTLFGTGVGLIGFICQFQGFRSVHWLCAIVQLGATGIMTLIRALIRGGFTVNPEVKSVDKDHEIDELAMMLANNDEWLSKDSVLKVTSSACKKGKEPAPAGFGTPQPHTTDESAAVASGDLLSTGETLEPVFQVRMEHLAHLSYLDDAMPEDGRSEEDRYGQRAVDIGCRLRDMTQWKTPISEAAVAVATAIKFMMDEFLDGKIYLWILDLPIDGQLYPIWINVTSKASDIVGKRLWDDLSEKVESILSLWLLEIKKKKKKQNQKPDKNAERESKDDVGSHLGQLNSFFLGRDIDGTSREISWWSNGQIVPKVVSYTHLSNFNRVYGFLGTKPVNCTPTLPLERGVMRSVLTVTSRANDKLILAQQLFSAFMWSFANHLPFYVFSQEVSVNPKPEFKITDHSTWTSVEVVSSKLRRVIQMIHLRGLGTEQEVLTIFVPPLIERSILTGQVVVDLVVRECNKIQARSDYWTCFWVYPELLALVTPGARELLTCKILAVYIELLSTPWPANGLRFHEQSQYERSLWKLKAYLSVDFTNKKYHRASCAEDSPKGSRISCLNKVRQLYFGQGRQKDFANAINWLEAGKTVDFVQEMDARESNEKSSDSVLKLEDCRLFGMNGSQLDFSHGDDLECRDILGWTSRHYAASLDTGHFVLRNYDFDDKLDIANRNPFHYLTCVEYRELFAIERRLGSQMMVDRDGISWLHSVIVQTILPDDRSEILESFGRELIDKYSLFGLIDNFGRTCTHLAIQIMQKELVLVLLSYSAFDPNAKDKKGQSLLLYACLSAIAVPSMLEIVTSLLGRGAGVDEPDVDHQTALYHTASVEPDSETQSIDMSVQSGQSSAEGANKKSPRQKESRFLNALKVAEILLQHGANVESNKRCAPLAKAREMWYKREENSRLMVNLLEEGLKKAKQREERDKITRYFKP